MAPGAASSLVLMGMLLGGLLVVHGYAARHLTVDEIPLGLRGRIERANRMRPWLFLVALLMACSGLLVAWQ